MKKDDWLTEDSQRRSWHRRRLARKPSWIYYVSVEEGVPIDEIIARFTLLTSIDNLVFLETT